MVGWIVVQTLAYLVAVCVTMGALAASDSRTPTDPWLRAAVVVLFWCAALITTLIHAQRETKDAIDTLTKMVAKKRGKTTKQTTAPKHTPQEIEMLSHSIPRA